MKAKSKPLPKLAIKAIFWASLVVLSFVLYLVIKPFYDLDAGSFDSRGVVARIVCVGLIIGVIVFFYFYYYRRGKLTFDKLILGLFLIAYILRLGYILYTPVDYRQHDTGGDVGHEAYAFTLFFTGKLPDSNTYQFYHPPFNAALQAIWMQIIKPILTLINNIAGYDVYDLHIDSYGNINGLYESCMLLSLYYSLITMWFMAKLIVRFNISKSAKILSICFIFFFPRLIQFSGQLNNDAITVCLGAVSLYFAYDWYKSRSWISIMLVAISIGLSMCAKLSGGVIAIPIAFIFIYVFIKDIIDKKNDSKDKKIYGTLFQFFAFLGVCVPLGLWFSVYAYVRFNQPFGYVFGQEGGLGPDLYCGDKSIFDRFINIFNFPDICKNLFCNSYEDHNLFGFVIKSAVFGEWSYNLGVEFAFIAVVTNYIFVIAAFIYFVIYMIISKKENVVEKWTGFIFILAFTIAQIYFNVKMPYGCTMDFRYIVPIIFGYSILLGYSYDKIKETKLKPLGFGVNCLAIAFLGSSSLFYLTTAW